MFDFDVEVHSGSDLLAQLGLDGRAIRTILEEPAPFDPRGDEGRVGGKRGEGEREGAGESDPRPRPGSQPIVIIQT